MTDSGIRKASADVPEGSPGAPGRLEQAATSDRRLLTRSSVTLISRGFAKSAQIIFLVVAARLLTVEEFATYSYMLVLATVFSFVSEIGVPIVAGRDVSAGRARPGDLYAAALPVVVVSAGVAALLVPLFTAVDSGPGSTLVPALLVATFVLFNRLFEFQATILRGVGRFNVEAAIQAGGAVIVIAGGTAATAAGLGVSAVLAVLCVKEGLSGLLAYAVLREDLTRSAGPPPIRWRQLLRTGIRLSLAGLALVLVMRLPLVVLGNSGTARQVALFSAAQRFADAAWLLAATAGVSLLPGIAYLARADRPRARRLVRRVLLAAGAAAAVLALAAQPLAEPAMRLLFGSGYSSGGTILQIILAGLPAYVALGISWNAIVAIDGEPRLLNVGLAGIFVAVIAAALLVPSGATGAAWAFVISLYVMATFSLATLVRELRTESPIAIWPAGYGRS
jgi:O-antigen/teichoic acid export membrane protein